MDTTCSRARFSYTYIYVLTRYSQEACSFVLIAHFTNKECSAGSLEKYDNSESAGLNLIYCRTDLLSSMTFELQLRQQIEVLSRTGLLPTLDSLGIQLKVNVLISKLTQASTPPLCRNFEAVMNNQDDDIRYLHILRGK